MLNIWELALLELRREGRKPSDKNYGMLWERRAFQILDYISHRNRKRRN